MNYEILKPIFLFLLDSTGENSQILAFSMLYGMVVKITIEIRATKVDSKTDSIINVKLVLANEINGQGREDTPLVFEGTAVVAQQNDNTSPNPLSDFPGKTCNLNNRSLYDDFMYHGPKFQGVKRLISFSESGINAELITIGIENFFTGIDKPIFEIDAGLLDAAGQLVGFWFTEMGERDFIVFPYELESLYLYGGPLPPGTQVYAHARLETCGERQWTTTMDLSDTNGTLVARLSGFLARRRILLIIKRSKAIKLTTTLL
jgi:hypothetical protein